VGGSARTFTAPRNGDRRLRQVVPAAIRGLPHETTVIRSPRPEAIGPPPMDQGTDGDCPTAPAGGEPGSPPWPSLLRRQVATWDLYQDHPATSPADEPGSRHGHQPRPPALAGVA